MKGNGIKASACKLNEAAVEDDEFRVDDIAASGFDATRVIGDPTRLDLLGTYTRIWALQQAAQCSLFDLLAKALQAAGPNGMNDRSFMALKVKSDPRAPYLLPFIIGAAIHPSPTLVLLAHLGNILLHVTRAPFIWDHELWDMLTECCVVISLVGYLLGGDRQSKDRIATGASVIRECMPWVRAQMITFYFGAAFWKLNRSFFDLRSSCAPVFIMQLLAALLPESMTPDALISLLAMTAPVVTILVEFAIPILLSLRGRWRIAGLSLGLLFHFLIALTPPPNNAGGFSVGAVVRYFFFMPMASASALAELRNASILIGGVGAVALSVYFGALQAAMTFQGALPIFVVLFVLYLRAVSISLRGGMQMAGADASGPHVVQWTGSKTTKRFGQLLMAVSFVYTFALPVLGLQDMGACNMFANLHGPTAVYTGMNHFLLPTGVLQAVYEQAEPSGAFAGGVVEVLYTDSPWIRNLFPAEGSRMLTERARAMLLSAGHSAREFTPSTTRVVGTLPGMKPLANQTEQLAYLLPAVELRRVLGEARARNESFDLRYRRLSRSAPFNGRVVLLREAAGGERSCWLEGVDKGKPCATDELALLPPSNNWATYMLLAFPMPMRPDGTSELGCLA